MAEEETEETFYPSGQYEKAFKSIFQELQKLNQLLAILGRLTLSTTPNAGLRVSADNFTVGTIYGANGIPTGSATLGSASPAVATSYPVPVFQVPIDQRFEVMQRGNIEYNECQRSKMAFS
jgi:hypothetical protein